MTLSASTPRSRPNGSAVQIEQVYVTHCLPTDSVRNHAGFSVRAASTTEPAVHKFAFDYPAYELPMDLWSANPQPAQAPARLALVSGPGESAALVHSAYVEKDTVGRNGSYFTHLLLCSRLTLAEALQTWGSREWTTAYPSGLPQQLPSLPRLPAPGQISDKAVTAFLTATGKDANPNLATTTCPGRLPADPQRRQELLRLALHGCLLAVRAGPAAPRGRFYLLAEPGLTALLLYAVARLLPSRQIEALTFSTYENLHRLRQYKLARIIGTFVGNPDKGLDPEFVLTRGYALDTFQTSRSSPEVLAAQSAEVNELVELAVRGDWAEARKCYHYHPAEAVTVESLAAARKFHDLAQRARSGPLPAEDLLALANTPEGQQFLKRSADLLWPHVRECSLTSSAVRQAYHELLRERFADLKAQAAGQLGTAAWPRWQQYWELIQSLRGRDANGLRADFLEMLPQADAHSATRGPLGRLRLPLLREWQRLQPAGDALPPPLERLLAVETSAELEQLRTSGLPVAWLGVALRHALHREATETAAVQLLRSADAELLGVFCRDLLPQIPPEKQTSLLAMVLAGPGSESQQQLARLLESGLHAPPETILKLLKLLRANEPEWVEFWRQGNHLALLLASLREYGEGAARVWDCFGAGLNKQLLHGNKDQKQLCARLQEARAAVGDAIPQKAAALLDDWGLLLAQLEGSDATAEPAEIDAACERYGAPFEAVLKAHFTRVIQDLPANDAACQRFSDAVTAYYPHGHGEHYQDAVALFRQWLLLVKDCKDPARQANFQLLFARRHLPVAHHRALARELKAKLAVQAYETLRRAQPEAETPAAPPGQPMPWDAVTGWLPARLSGRARVGLVLAASHLVIFAVAFLLGRSASASSGAEALDRTRGEYAAALATLGESLRKDLKSSLPVRSDIVSNDESSAAYKNLGGSLDRVAYKLTAPGHSLDLKAVGAACQELKKSCERTRQYNKPLEEPYRAVALDKQTMDRLLQGTMQNQPAFVPERMNAVHRAFFPGYCPAPVLASVWSIALAEELKQLSRQAASLGTAFDEAANARTRAEVVDRYVRNCLAMQALHRQLAEAQRVLKKTE